MSTPALKNKLIVITGASSGIGYALSVAVAKRGFCVLAVARRQDLLKSLQHHHDRIDILSADISTRSGRAKLVSAIRQYQQSIYLIHNAAIALPKTLPQLTSEDWRQALAINLEAPMWLTKACEPYYNHSRILHVSSGLAHYALAGTAAYSLTKAALYMLYQVINKEYEPTTVIAGSLRPGVIDTPMQTELRTADSEHLPSKPLFEQFYLQQKLRPPTVVAEYIADVLLNTSDEVFKKEEWDINAAAQQVSLSS